MYKYRLAFAVITLLNANVLADEPNAFTSDACSWFPESLPFSESDWCSCCYVHDIAYWMGGTVEQRLAVDVALKACVLEKSTSKVLAVMMFQGVRLGGSPHLKTSFRWGYGWSWDFARKYQPLTLPEQSRADALLADDQNPGSICE